ncbi:MAG TPA: signal recognition particle-docking protein FtsY [Candidatus Pacearchaeota archaeon]|nr:signal recognition particle-docking protein FtsY [Candidatus Pacearchaeota archaeon]
MFKFLKEKISKWAKKISLEAEKTEKVAVKKIEEEKPKEIPTPMKFNLGMQQFQPDLEKIEEIGKEKGQEESKKPEKESFLKRITSKVQKIRISEKEFEIYSEELSMLLLENNVAFEVAKKIIEELKEEIVGKELLKKEIESEIKEALAEIIGKILIEPFDLGSKINEKKEDQAKEPYIILFVGINGTGKTTTVAKIAKHLSKKGISSVLAAGDTFRAASIEQLKKHGEKLGINVISQQYGSDPAAVGFDAIKYAKKNFIDCVLIDTAGRMHTSKNLMKEIEKISRVCKPDTKIFVGESITGNDSIEQVKSFDWVIGIDGIILTKADVDEKGGTALSLGYVTKKPILFLGTGQEYEAIEVFDKKKFLKELGL